MSVWLAFILTWLWACWVRVVSLTVIPGTVTDWSGWSAFSDNCHVRYAGFTVTDCHTVSVTVRVVCVTPDDSLIGAVDHFTVATGDMCIPCHETVSDRCE